MLTLLNVFSGRPRTTYRTMGSSYKHSDHKGIEIIVIIDGVRREIR